MEREIYDGLAEGKFEQTRFNRFMNKYLGATCVLSNASFFSSTYDIYHVQTQGVTLIYELHPSRAASDDGRNMARVTLFGGKTQISKIEKKILKH